MTTSTVFESAPTGLDSSAFVVGASSGTGSVNLSVGETSIINFDFTDDTNGDSGTFLGSPPNFGTLNLDTNTGEATLTITHAQWQAAGYHNTLSFSVLSQGAFTSALVSLSVTCFAEGTGIATPDGDRAVEDLTPGDTVLTADGRTLPVAWVGMQTISTVFAETTERLRLVEIAPGALGDGLPRRVLRVTADHAMVLDGLLINASALVGRPGIGYVPHADLPATYRVYHVELDQHEVILAEGAPTESFIDLMPRGSWDNYDAYLARFGAPRILPELPMPRISAARLLPKGLRAA